MNHFATLPKDAYEKKIGTQLEDEVYQDLKMAAAQEPGRSAEVIRYG